jgi:hypothetical protein
VACSFRPATTIRIRPSGQASATCPRNGGSVSPQATSSSRSTWLAYTNEHETPTRTPSERWKEDHKQLLGTVTFPRQDADSSEARTWRHSQPRWAPIPATGSATRATRCASPSTEFAVARKLAYQKSQDGRGALPPDAYRSVFESGEINPELARELSRRRDAKTQAGHVDRAP